MKLTRRKALGALSLVPLACSRPPTTPLAHLTGRNWVEEVYELHAQRYLDVQLGAETKSHGAYRVLAQKGIASLEALQHRDVPFFMKVDPQSQKVQIARSVPERLTFKTGMNAAERRRATHIYHEARKHLHTDYFEINRLDWALSTLLEELLNIHAAMEQAELEQFRMVRDLVELRGGKETPYQLPQGVSRKGYEEVLLLLVIRLEKDRFRLAIIEASIAAVGLTARASDAGSGSLASNLNRVLLDVIRDANATAPEAAAFPKSKREDELRRARKLAREIETSRAYLAWRRAQRQASIDAVGMLFEAIDTFTHLPTSALYRTVINIWQGEGDYLSYLKSLATIVPGGGQIAASIKMAVTTTERARNVVVRAQEVVERARQGTLGEALRTELEERGGALLNTKTRFGRSRLSRQLSFFKNQQELDETIEEVGATELIKRAMPAVPAAKRR